MLFDDTCTTSAPARRRIRRRVTALAAAAALAAAGVVASAGAAQAAFPGGNGKIYFASGDAQVWSVNPDGTDATQLTSAGFNQNPQVSPGGGKVAFVRFAGGIHSINVYTMNPDGSGVTQITTFGLADFNSVAWSPDGTRLVIGDDLTAGMLSIINADGSGQTPLGVTGQFPAWSPDGTEIAYTDCAANCNIYTVHPDGTGVTQVTSLASGLAAFYASWSPDGSKLVFAVQDNVPPFGPDQIYTINANGTGLTDISNDTDFEYSPVWSPDGTKIAYGDDTTGTVNVMNPDGSGKTAILTNSGSAPTSWANLLAVTTTSLPGATLGAAYSATLAAVGGSPPYTWAISSGQLPPGLSLNAATGAITGTPVLAGTASFTVQVTDTAGQTATAALSITASVGPGGTVITGTHSGPLHIGPGVTSLSGATITGPVSIAPGAVVSITGSTLSGPLSASGTSSLAVCGTSVSGPVSVTGASGLVLIGGTSGSPCGKDTIGGPVNLRSDSGGVDLAGNSITGPATLTGNTGPPMIVAGNGITGQLTCSGNSPAPADNGQPNTVSGSATGQCSALI